MSSYRLLYKLLKKYAPGKNILDYGCGHGLHAIQMSKFGAQKVTGIDLSEESLKIARKRAEKEKITNVQFLKTDAERLDLPDNSFDIVFDGGTFSSINIETGLKEIARVLKSDGLLIGIETLGHNPLANLKRWLNKKRGVRTPWATSHIMKVKDFKLAKKYFKKTEVRFFHLLSLLALPLQNIPGGKIFLKTTEVIDKLLTKIPLLRIFSFKTVFILKKN
jgi:ubiquinone/menaquinone biosynthesis C-methylase UbiE